MMRTVLDRLQVIARRRDGRVGGKPTRKRKEIWLGMGEGGQARVAAVRKVLASPSSSTPLPFRSPEIGAGKSLKRGGGADQVCGVATL